MVPLCSHYAGAPLSGPLPEAATGPPPAAATAAAATPVPQGPAKAMLIVLGTSVEEGSASQQVSNAFVGLSSCLCLKNLASSLGKSLALGAVLVVVLGTSVEEGSASQQVSSAFAGLICC